MRTPTYIIALSVLLLAPTSVLADSGEHKDLNKDKSPFTWTSTRAPRPFEYVRRDHDWDHDWSHYNRPNPGVGNGNHYGWQNSWNRAGDNSSYPYRPNYNSGNSPFNSGYSPFYNSGYSSFSQSANEQIRRGANSGRLSSREVAELSQKAAEVRRDEFAFSRDGYLSNSERGEISSDINDFNKKLNHELNDGEHRW